MGAVFIIKKKGVADRYVSLIVKVKLLYFFLFFFVFLSHMMTASFSKYNLDCFSSAAFVLSMKCSCLNFCIFFFFF